MRTTAGICISLVALIAFAAIAVGVGQADDVRLADDGWRRTARGWEHTQAWTAPDDGVPSNRFAFGKNLREPRPRWDIHPGLLVVAQVLFVCAAFYVWPTVANKHSDATVHKGDENAVVPERRPNTVA